MTARDEGGQFVSDWDAFCQQCKGLLQPEIKYGDWWEVETSEGTEWVPAWLFSRHQLDQCLEGKLIPNQELRKVPGFGARLSAPGFLDCTSWVVCASREEAKKHLIDTYWDDTE
jgi:hypothetical protein